MTKPFSPAPGASQLAEDGAMEADLPCAAGLMAATLALMTAWAEPEPGDRCEAARLRTLFARKLACNLSQLREHPDIAHPLQQVIARLHQRWVLIALGADDRTPATPLAPHPRPAMDRRH